jgi:hypothetical protein
MPIAPEVEIIIVCIGLDEDTKAKWKGYIKYPPDKKKSISRIFLNLPCYLSPT